MDIVKESLVKDGKLIVHIGRKDIEGTRFFILTPETAADVRELINEFLDGQACNDTVRVP